MKKQIGISLLAIVIVISLFSIGFAQRQGMGRGPGGGMGMCAMLPDLTDGQKAKIEEIWLAHQKEIQPHQLQMQKMRIELHELMIVEKPDLKKIHTKQEEMSKARLEMQKKGVAHRLAVRELLTEKQRIIFDKHPMGPGRGAGFHRGHRGNFQGPQGGPGMRGAGPCWNQPVPDNEDDE